MEENLDLKSFYLRLLKKLWMIPVAAIVGALLGLGIYYLATVTFGPGVEYASESRFDVEFAYDEEGMTMVDHYNAGTWKQKLTDDNIMEETLKDLEAEGVLVERELLEESIEADTPFDPRVLVITVKNTDKELVDKVTAAIDENIEKFGADRPNVFRSIKLTAKGVTKPVSHRDRSLVAAIFGAIVAALALLFALLLADAVDDAIYVPEECERRYKIPTLGVISEAGSINDILKNELTDSFDQYVQGAENVYFISTDSLKDYERSSKDLEVLKSVLGEGRSECVSKLTPMEIPGKVLENYRKINESGGVVLAVPMGKKLGTMTDHVISQLKKHNCPVLGILIVRADAGFIKRYYGMK